MTTYDAELGILSNYWYRKNGDIERMKTKALWYYPKSNNAV